MNTELREAVSECLDDIDRLLPEKNVSLGLRPLYAADIFVKECIVEIKGATKEGYLSQPWFYDIWDEIDAWYRRRYGAALRRHLNDLAPGLVMIFGAPFRLQLPLSFWTDRKGKTGRLHLPKDVCAGEDPFTWIEASPNVGDLTEQERDALRADVYEVVKHTRSINVDLLTASKGGDHYRALAYTVSTHLTKAVNDVMSDQGADIATAMWELHLAMEKALKAFLAQRALQIPRTHDLNRLYRAALAGGLPPLPSGLAESLPSEQDSISQRYGEGAPPSIAMAHDSYRRALAVVYHCIHHLKGWVRVQGTDLSLDLRGFGRPTD
jgi:hypothetical protein